MQHPLYIMIACILLSLFSPTHASAPSSTNTNDTPDPQRLPLTRLACGCKFIKQRLKAVPIIQPPQQAFLDISTKKTLLRHTVKIKKESKKTPTVAEKAPDALECSCHTVKVEVHPTLSSNPE